MRFRPTDRHTLPSYGNAWKHLIKKKAKKYIKKEQWQKETKSNIEKHHHRQRNKSNENPKKQNCQTIIAVFTILISELLPPDKPSLPSKPPVVAKPAVPPTIRDGPPPPPPHVERNNSRPTGPPPRSLPPARPLPPPPPGGSSSGTVFILFVEYVCVCPLFVFFFIVPLTIYCADNVSLSGNLVCPASFCHNCVLLLMFLYYSSFLRLVAH